MVNITNRERAILQVRRHGNILEFLDDVFKNDEYIVLEASKQNIKAFKYASHALKSNKKFILHAIKNNGMLLKFVNNIFKNDSDIVSEAVKQNRHSLKYASYDLQNNEEIRLLAESRIHKKIRLS